MFLISPCNLACRPPPHHTEEKTTQLETGIRIKGIDVFQDYLLIWNGSTAEIYRITSNEVIPISNFTKSSNAMGIYNDTIFVAEGSQISLCNLKGVEKSCKTFTKTEGNPILIDIHNEFMAVGTSRGIIKMFQVKGREPKELWKTSFTDANLTVPEVEEKRPTGTTRYGASSNASQTSRPRLLDNNPKRPGPKNHSLQQSQQKKQSKLGKISSIRCNANGIQVSVLCEEVTVSEGNSAQPQFGSELLSAAGERRKDTETQRKNENVHLNVFVYHSERGKFQQFSFGPYRNPVEHYWDKEETDYFCVESSLRQLSPAAIANLNAKSLKLTSHMKTQLANLAEDESYHDGEVLALINNPKSIAGLDVDTINLWNQNTKKGNFATPQQPLQGFCFLFKTL